MCFRPVEAARKIPCPKCGTPNINTAKTCYKCGAALKNNPSGKDLEKK